MTVDNAAIKSFNDNARWILDQHRCLNLYLLNPEGHPVHAWIAPRQHYCDRGHWEFKVDAPALYLDAADSFPRYFMDLETAIIEAEAWLRWRLFRQTATPYFSELINDHDGRAAFVKGEAHVG